MELGFTESSSGRLAISIKTTSSRSRSSKEGDFEAEALPNSGKSKGEGFRVADAIGNPVRIRFLFRFLARGFGGIGSGEMGDGTGSWWEILEMKARPKLLARTEGVGWAWVS
ncbi:hypothetical protein AAC387_Pa04g2259 [Persea americana]